MGNMLDWAENEVKLACERESEYGIACYESALKAYRSLMDDEHSGASIRFTKTILNRLIDGSPLTPIEDTDDVWGEFVWCSDDRKIYQCKRMRSLFKYVYSDGCIKYRDINRVRCRIVGEGVLFSSKLGSDIVDEIYPLKMPYCGEYHHYIVNQEEVLFDSENGDYDTVHIKNIECPDSTIKNIDRYFKEDCDSYSGWAEISKDEYELRKRSGMNHD